MGMMVYGQKTSKTARDKEAMAFYFKEGDAFDFGKVPQGPALLHTFEFVNDSKTPIVIATVEPSVDWITVSWPREAVLPGEKGTISLIYDTRVQAGPFKKIIQIWANITKPNEPYKLYVTGTIVPVEKDEPVNR